MCNNHCDFLYVCFSDEYRTCRWPDCNEPVEYGVFYCDEHQMEYNEDYNRRLTECYLRYNPQKSYSSGSSKNYSYSNSNSTGGSYSKSNYDYDYSYTYDSYDDGYDAIYMDGDYDYDRYEYDSEYADGVDDAMDELGEDW